MSFTPLICPSTHLAPYLSQVIQSLALAKLASCYCKTLNFGVNLIILDPVILAFLLPTTLKRYCIQIFAARYYR